MLGRLEESGFEVRLRGRGFGRWLDAVFLTLWLGFWVVGEVFAIWLLVVGALSLWSGEPPEPGRESLALGPSLGVGAFLLVWLTFWTLGGLAATRELLRATVGEDRLTIVRGALRVREHVGPIPVSSTQLDVEVRAITATDSGVLVAETSEGDVELSKLGTAEQRAQAAFELSQRLGLPSSPPGSLSRDQ